MALAEWLTPEGRVDVLDIGQEFLDHTAADVAAISVGGRISTIDDRVTCIEIDGDWHASWSGAESMPPVAAPMVCTRMNTCRDPRRVRKTRIKRRDLRAIPVENDQPDWSFGRGEASYVAITRDEWHKAIARGDPRGRDELIGG